MFSSLLAFCFMPLGEPVRIGAYTLTLWVAESPVGLLIVLGLSSISVFGVIFGGWAANSKYPLMGALRSVVQVLSYEIPLGLTVLTVAFAARSMDLVEIVRRQESSGVWYGFLMPVSFVVFWISAVAETNRAPFDLPEAESELVAGYHTEYSGMKFAYFYMAEYAHMVLVSSLVVNLFFGGWLAPFPSVPALDFLEVVPGLRLVPREDHVLPLPLCLDPGDLPALPLRLAHPPGLEMAHPARAPQFPGRRAA